MSIGSYEDHNRNSQQSANGGGSQSIPSFLLKTYEILENSTYSDIICWTKTGQGFVVKKVKEFAEKILPTHFRHSNYTSFVRQLNMYDFHKTRQENQENAFKNFMFKKGHRHLLKDIQRKDYKKNKQTRNQLPNEKPESDMPMEKRQDREHQVYKGFYSTSLQTLINFSNQLQDKVTELAEIRQIKTTRSSSMQILDLLFEAKRINRTAMLQITHFGEKWNSFLSLSQLSIQRPIEQEKQCKLQSHALTTANSLPQ